MIFPDCCQDRPARRVLPGDMNACPAFPEPASTLRTSTSLLRVLIAADSSPDWERCWTRLDRTYREILMAMARKAGLRHHEAEDVTQEVFSELVRSLAGFEIRARRGSFRSYLFQLLHWRIANKRQHQRRQPAGEFDPAEPGDAAPTALQQPPPAPSDEEEFCRTIARAMMILARSLSPRDVQVLEHYYCKNWPAARISAAFGLPAATVYVIAHRHKLRLVKALVRCGWDWPLPAGVALAAAPKSA
jgi:RNA polymerase sigma factor (sigma-70 family)